MQVLMLIYEPQTEFAKRSSPDADSYYAGWMAYVQALREAGVMTGGNALALPDKAATLRVDGGQRHVQDGPFADTKEQLGGYFVLEVPDMETALDWAARCPSQGAALELRPVMQPGAM